jgi:hypothetical protein
MALKGTWRQLIKRVFKISHQLVSKVNDGEKLKTIISGHMTEDWFAHNSMIMKK